MSETQPGERTDTDEHKTAATANPAFSWLGVAGIAVGAVAGVVAFEILLRIGVVALALPGAAVGLGRALTYRDRSWALGVLSAAVGLAVTLLVIQLEFVDGISRFDRNMFISTVAGTLLAFWLGIGRSRRG